MSSLSIQAIIELRMPELVTSPDPRLADFIKLSKGMTGQEFGDCYNQAVALRVLHWLEKEKQSGGTSSSSSVHHGKVTSEKEGQLAITYQKGSSTTNDKYGDLSTTQYGNELIELMKGCLLLPRTRIGTSGYPFQPTL